MTTSNAHRVRPLVWNCDTPLDGVEQFRAKSVVGTYSVFGSRCAAWNWSNSLGGMSDTRGYLSADEAKAAAQADYEARILSALDSRPVALADANPKSTAKDSELAEARAALAETVDAIEDGLCNSGIPGFDGTRLDRALTRARTVLSREASSNE